MHARAVAATTTALLGATALLLPTPAARAGSRRADSPLVIAHRGASAYAPENTLAAVDKAAATGLRLGRERRPAHQGRRARRPPRRDAGADDRRRGGLPGRAPWKVKDFTAAEIARLDAGSWFGARYAGARVPTLEQYMRPRRRNHQKLLLEIKNPELYPGIEQETLKVLGNEGWLDPAHLGTGWSSRASAPTAVRTVHELRPAVKTGFLGTPPSPDLPEYATFSRPDQPLVHAHLRRAMSPRPRVRRVRTAGRWRSSPGP